MCHYIEYDVIESITYMSLLLTFLTFLSLDVNALLVHVILRIFFVLSTHSLM